MIKSVFAAVSLAGVLVALTRAAAAPPSAAVAPMDRKFMVAAAQGGLAEVKLGKLAREWGEDADVKHFGRMMMDDHSRLNQELLDLAKVKGVPVPPGLAPEHRATLDRLSKLSGGAFDRAYIADMVEDHQKDVHEFKMAAASCKDPDLKTWAAMNLPVLEDHLKMARDTAVKLGAKPGKRK